MTAPPIRTYGRTKSRSLKPGQAGLIDQLLPRLAIAAGPFDPAAEAAGRAETWLEIGFGGGEHLAAQAALRPDVLFLGAEPFLNGLASVLRHIREQNLANVRLFAGDGRALMAALPAACVGRLFLLFPDPWPKTRHHKRRLVDATFVAEAARVLAPAGRLRFATDWTSYADQALEVFTRSDAFEWTATRADHWRLPPADHATTRYELKRLGDTAPIWLEFVRT